MSIKVIQEYYRNSENYKQFGQTTNESSIRRAFANLLEHYCHSNNLYIIDELHLKESKKRPDATVRNSLGLDFGHWESKDENDNLDKEIFNKQNLGYPTFNIIFENSIDIVLIQENKEVLRGKIADEEFLDRLIIAFVSYERKEIREYRLAIEKFANDVPRIVSKLRIMIVKQFNSNNNFIISFNNFWEICKKSINPEISKENIIEMLIQHILTDEIFTSIFNDAAFHRENIIGKQLNNLINTFFERALRRKTLSSIDNYYLAIKAEASRIVDHHQKQHFLKIIYENFYKAYNPKAADKLGIVYTPTEIVQFMIKSTDHLLDKHFHKGLKDKNVEILDPATGTGTFIVDIIDYIPKQYLEYKYKNEIHANEVAILPYYIANLNIEYTYQQKMLTFEPFNNIVFVDTLDNLGFNYNGKQFALEDFGFNEENLARIKNQNEKKISVIIGNPPYNANQQNENDNNKNRLYPQIDKRIKETFIFNSKAQKTKLYDMYARFFRWAMDRIDDEGIIAFVTNRSYIDSKTYDGFRKILKEEFDFCYIIDTKSDVRKNPKIAGTTHNVFGIQTGIAVIFLVKNGKSINDVASINYFSLDDEILKKDKLQWLIDNQFEDIPFERIRPNFNEKWINQAEINDWDSLIKIASKNAKLNRGNETIFEFYSLGVSTNRDNWVFDFSEKNLQKKIKFFVKKYNELLRSNDNSWDTSIKWSADLKKYFSKKLKLTFNKNIAVVNYRPFTKKYYSIDKMLSDRLTENHYRIFGKDFNNENFCICIDNNGGNKILMTNKIADLHFTGDTQIIPFYIYDTNSDNKKENITDWSLNEFRTHYNDNKIEKINIFHYVYAVLYNPNYRSIYEINLKEDFPAIPFYKDFKKWSDWGEELVELHLNYENVEKYNLNIINIENKFDKPKVKLKIDKLKGEIVIDENTIINGIPETVWKYQLGNRSPLEWVTDQYKEKKMDEQILQEKFNDYRFSDYKELFIDLIQKLVTVSISTVDIMNKMEIESTNQNESF